MKRQGLNERVGIELKSIPPGHRGSTQNFFRAAYNMVRRHDLSVDPNAARRACFDRALEQVRKTAPNFTPVCDRQFFGVQMDPSGFGQRKDNA